MRLTIDASVWVSAFIAGDVPHPQADELLEVCLILRAKVVVPDMVLLEVAAGVARMLSKLDRDRSPRKKLSAFPALNSSR